MFSRHRSRRPPRNPAELFKAFLIMRMKAIRSLREMTRILNTDQRIRMLCLIKNNQEWYKRCVMSRFSKRMRQDNLNRIIGQKVIKLLNSQQGSEADVVLDASFIKAWSMRHSTDNQIVSRAPSKLRGFSVLFWGLYTRVRMPTAINLVCLKNNNNLGDLLVVLPNWHSCRVAGKVWFLC